MITTIIALLLLLVGSMFDFTYIKDLMPTYIAITIVAIIITFAFWSINFIIYKTPKLDRYVKNWDEPVIIIWKSIYSILVCVLLSKILWNYETGLGYLDNTLVLWIILFTADIASIYVLSSVYSLELKDSILESIMLQIHNVRNGLLILLAFTAILKFTIVGFLLIIIIIGIFISLFKL